MNKINPIHKLLHVDYFLIYVHICLNSSQSVCYRHKLVETFHTRVMINDENSFELRPVSLGQF
jgi:hypothetical protein